MSAIIPTQDELKNWPEGYDFCEVCLIKEGMQQDDLIFCELCNGLIHQSCYGSELLDNIPENDWYCERCREFIKDYCNEAKLHETGSLRCFFCPEQKGIVKRITIQQSGAQIWSHVGCITSMKSLNFVDSTRTLIVQRFCPKKTADECKVCGQKTGNCGFCHKNGCKFTFHFSCGKRIGILQDVNLMNTLIQCREKQFKNAEPEHHVVFCEQHLYELRYLEYPEDKFLQDFIDGMNAQKQIFDAEGENLSCILTNSRKCEIIKYDKNLLIEQYEALGNQKRSQLKKHKKVSQLKQSHQNKDKERSKSRSRSRSNSPDKSDRKAAGGKKSKEQDKETESTKKLQHQKSRSHASHSSSSQIESNQKLTSTNEKPEKEEIQKKIIEDHNGDQKENKTKVQPIVAVIENGDSKNTKQKIPQPLQSQQSQNNSSKADQQINTSVSQILPQPQKKGQGKKGVKNEEDQQLQLLENQDNWRRIQKVMQTYDYRDKANIIEEQKTNDEPFQIPNHVLDELAESLPKRVTIEQDIKSQNKQDSSIKNSVEESNKLDKVSTNQKSGRKDSNGKGDVNNEDQQCSTNKKSKLQDDENILDQDKIIEEEKQNDQQNEYIYHENGKKGKEKTQTANQKDIITTISKSKSVDKQDISSSEKDMDIEEAETLTTQKRLKAKSSKMSDNDKQRVYKRFILEYVKLNRSKLKGPHSLYIIHPEMMQIMQIQSAMPQRKWKKDIAHYFVQKECLNPIQREIQMKKCINQRIIDIFADRNIPPCIPSKHFYKIFKAQFMIKVYDNKRQLSEFEDEINQIELLQQKEQQKINNHKQDNIIVNEQQKQSGLPVQEKVNHQLQNTQQNKQDNKQDQADIFKAQQQNIEQQLNDLKQANQLNTNQSPQQQQEEKINENKQIEIESIQSEIQVQQIQNNIQNINQDLNNDTIQKNIYTEKQSEISLKSQLDQPSNEQLTQPLSEQKHTQSNIQQNDMQIEEEKIQDTVQLPDQTTNEPNEQKQTEAITNNEAKPVEDTNSSVNPVVEEKEQTESNNENKATENKE